MRITGQAGQMVCYHCQQPRHMRRDFPQRQESQGFGTTQSQSVAEQERIQYVPPQRDTGQRGQSQFQGATRAPHVSAACLRGQSIGRGRGRGPQAGYQGSRGVSTPSHRRLSQQISQSYRVRFCYLAYGQECYLIMVHRIHSLLHQL